MKYEEGGRWNGSYRRSETGGAAGRGSSRAIRWYARIVAERVADEDVTARRGFSPPRVTRFRITVVSGPDRGKVVDVDAAEPSRVLIGQSPSCKLQLTDREVSRRHAAVDVTERGLHLVDLGSTNGTFVADTRVRDVELRGGTTIALGASTLRVDAIAAGTPDVPVDAWGVAVAFGKTIGASPAMRRIYPLCERLAQSTLPVLIEGETGTGKEVLAEALHDRGPRADKPFVVFDCTAVPPSLVESALFGHERGAFTGATSRRLGVFEQANGGTLLIDEIGELDLSVQPKLLRALQRGEVQRVGSNEWQRVDVRVLAATRRDLDQEVAAGRFRDDLFFRLAVGRLELPPLREREGDVELLTHHFWRALGATTPFPHGVVDRFRAYRWPGNVRELHNAVARVIAVGDVTLSKAGLTSGDDDAPLSAPAPGDDVIARAIAAGAPFPRAKEIVVEEFERRYVEHMLAAHGGNVVRAAAASGVARRYFQIVKKRYAK